MLKIEGQTKDKLNLLDYNSIPEGAVFTYVEDVDTVPNRGILFLKCQDGSSVMLNVNPGQIEDIDGFVQDEKLWVVLDSTLIIKR